MKIKKIYLLMQQLRYLTKLISLFLHVHNVYVISLNRAISLNFSNSLKNYPL